MELAICLLKAYALLYGEGFWLTYGVGKYLTTKTDDKKTTAMLLVLGIATSRAADLGTTHYFLQGDMSGEANPLAAIAGWSWPALLTSNIVAALVLVGFALFYGFGKTKRLLVPVNSATEFGGICLYNRLMSRAELTRRLLLSLPLSGSDWYQKGRFFGFVCSVAVITVGYAATFCWWATKSWGFDFVATIRKATAIGFYSLFEVGIAMIAAVLAAIWFFRSEWRLATDARLRGKLNVGDGADQPATAPEPQ